MPPLGSQRRRALAAAKVGIAVILWLAACAALSTAASAAGPAPARGPDYVLPRSGVAIPAAAPAGGKFQFTFDSPDHPWTADELATLQSWTAPGSAVMAALAQIAGPPPHDLTINVVHVPADGPDGYFAFGNPRAEMSLGTLRLDVFLHEMNHAVHNEWVIASWVWEEGMARAAEDEELRLVAAQGITEPQGGDPYHNDSFDVYYDALNVPDVGFWKDQLIGSGAMVFLRYEQSGYAFGKLLIEDPAFLKEFNARLFQQANGVLSYATLVAMAASSKPTIERQPFRTWYAAQHIFDPNPPTGCRMFQRISQWDVVFFCRDSRGSELAQSGATVTCSAYGYDGRLLYERTVVTMPLGWANCEPVGTGFGDYDGRVKMVASGDSASGHAESVSYRQSGLEQGVFGVVTNADTGNVTFSSPSGAFSAITVPVSNGAFKAPDLRAVRGTLEAHFSGEGRTADRVFTKAESPYALILTGVAPGKPDLVVSSLRWSPVAPTAGDAVEFSATVENQGAAATPSGATYRVAFLVDGASVAWSDQGTGSLGPGGSLTLTANGGPAGSPTWPATAGRHTVEAYVDDTNAVTESNEANNSREETLNVANAPPPAPPPISPPSLKPSGTASVAFLASTVKVKLKTGRGSVRVRCANVAEDRCAMRVQLKLPVASRAAKARTRLITIGSASGTVAGGKSGTITIALNHRGLALLRRAQHHTLRRVTAIGSAKNRLGREVAIRKTWTVKGASR